MRLHDALERARHHRFLFPALPLFGCQDGFFLAHFPFHTLDLGFPFRFKTVLYGIEGTHGLRLRHFLGLHLLGGIGIHLLPTEAAQFRPAFRRERHHRFVKAVDGRVGLPVQTAVDGILRVIVLRGFGSVFYIG